MRTIFLLAVWAAIYPTLLAAVTTMLLLNNPKRLMLGYLSGALLVSITGGLIVVFALGGGSAGTAQVKHNISPAVEVVFGLVLVFIALEFLSGRNQAFDKRVEKHRAAKAQKPPSKLFQRLQRGSARDTFVVGALLSVPGFTYLAAMGLTARQDLSTLSTVLVVLAFNAIMFLLLEIPLAFYIFAPDRTTAAVSSFKSLLTRNGGRILFWGAAIVGAALITIGVVHLLI